MYQVEDIQHFQEHTMVAHLGSDSNLDPDLYYWRK